MNPLPIQPPSKERGTGITGRHQGPAADSKSDDYGVPSNSDRKPWGKGFSFVFYDEEGCTAPHIEYVPIFGGRAIWRGSLYEARCDVDGKERFEGVR